MTNHRALRDGAVLAALVVAILALALVAPVGFDKTPGPVLLSLLGTALFVEALPINFPDRSAVTLSVLPAALLWYYCGPYAAAVGAGASIVAVRLPRWARGADRSAARAIISVWAAHVGAHAAAGLQLSSRVPDTYVGLAAFCLVFSIVSVALGAFIGDRCPRPEPFSSVMLLPLIGVLVGLARWRGQEMLPIFLLGSGAFLLLVRASVNMMTLHRRVTRLARQAEESAQALATVVNYSGDGIFTVDRELRIQHFNPALAALTGLRAETAVGRPVEEVLGAGHAPAVVGAALRRALREGRAVRIDSVLETPEGCRELTTSYTAVPGPGPNGFALGVGGVHDVTEEKEQARIREDFFSLVTHDLRNPLTSMIGNTYLLDQELARLLDETAPARKLVGRVEKANEQLLRLVNNLLDLQRIESGRELMHPQPVPLRPLVEEVVGEFRAMALERNQTIRLSGQDRRAWGDPTWCREILSNLLSNAIKYTPVGGEIDLAIEGRGGQVAVGVRDTGHGLTPEELEQLFSRFFRSKRPEIKSALGTGLGLALAKRMAERMGGDITVRSTVGAGSTFTVLLPLGDLPPFVEEAADHAEDVEPVASSGQS